ncbi:MAG: L,D-transpeptidase [Akkermansiaceae bacterium]|nr:L,D-transpeptidase [Akkermansiaceae bacterium]
MKCISLISILATGIFCVSLSSCGTSSSLSSQGLSGYQSYDLPASLPKDRSKVRVKVSTNNQMVYVMEGSKPLLVMPVSVGTSSTPTPKGHFRIFKKDHKHRANSHGFAYRGNQVRGCYLRTKPSGWSFKGTPMPYWCEFKANYGFHTGWMKNSPCTLGCIRMHENLSPKFFQLVKNGTPVYISYTQPEDATIGRNVPRPPDASPLPNYPASMMLSDGYFHRHNKPVYN